MFIGRELELDALEREYARPGSSLMVLYGRRRMGKTALCRAFSKGKRVLYFPASDEGNASNMDSFRRAASAFLGRPPASDASADDWYTLFRELADAVGPDGDRPIIIFDDFHRLCRASPLLPAAMRKAYNEVLSPAGVSVLLVGSHLPTMETQVLGYSSPLREACTLQLRLEPVSFGSCGSFFPEAGTRQLIELYSVIGGVPRYANLFQPMRDDIYAMIAEHVLSDTGSLREEPEFLLREEFSEPGTYFGILRAIAQGNQKMAHIAAVLGLPQTRLTPYLRTLRELDILTRDVPATESHPEKSKNGRYRITDNFLQFWFRFIYPNLADLEFGHGDAVLTTIKDSFASSHVTGVFRDICRRRMWSMSASGIWAFSLQKVGAWWNRTNEVDVVAVSGDNQNIVFGECIYSPNPVGMNVYQRLREKAARVTWGGTGRAEHYVLFAVSDFTEELSDAAKSGSALDLVVI